MTAWQILSIVITETGHLRTYQKQPESQTRKVRGLEWRWQTTMTTVMSISLSPMTQWRTSSITTEGMGLSRMSHSIRAPGTTKMAGHNPVWVPTGGIMIETGGWI